MLEKDTINITKYTIESDEKELYYIFIIPEDDDSMSFYIQKKGYGVISHAVGILTKDFKGLDIQDFIDANVNEWIEDCELDIEKLEQED